MRPVSPFPAHETGGRWPAVALRFHIDLPRPAAEVWPHVADLRRFACHDLFHRRLIVLAPTLRPGAALAIEHAALGVRRMRFGRLLWWREGRGYAFSDLSARGPRHGFPHIFVVELDDRGERECRLRLSVRGRWTARLVPRPLARLWLRAVMAAHARILRTNLRSLLDAG